MTGMQNALEAVTSASAPTDHEIAEHVAGRGTVGSLQQLRVFRANLSVMADQITSGAVPPVGQRLAGVGRAIADSWPSSSQLGGALLEAEQLYLKL